MERELVAIFFISELEFEPQFEIQILNGLASNDVIESVKDLSLRFFF